MGDRGVMVRVRMPHPCRHSRVRMVVMPVVVPVGMRMVHGFVRMLVLVSGREHEEQADDHGDRRSDLE